MDFTVENVCGFLIRSRLMTPDEMRAMKQRWQAEAKEPANLSLFARWLVTKEFVTEYQASLLAKGHGDPENFFLNQYRILDRLGRGRMAGVYKATHSLGQIVAIKVLPPSKAKNPQMMGRFQREAKLALRLKHPNVVRSFQVGETGGLHFLVMEYLDGETLEEVLQRRKRLPTGEAVRLLYQALTGLQHIHELNLVHRDLKPANLMITPGPGDADTTQQATIKILAIGLGRTLFDEQAPDSDGDVNLTGEGVLLGTPDYLAPEQARDPRSIDIRADIYSLGCVLYHCLTGQPPFPDKNILNQMVRHATEMPKPLKEFNPQIPDGLQQVLNWMLAKKPEQRYPTPERAAQALEVFLMADSLPAKSGDEAPHMRNYLTWLETTLPGDLEFTPGSPTSAPKAAPPLAIPVQPLSPPPPMPVAPLVAIAKATPAPPSRDQRKKKSKQGTRGREPTPTVNPLAPAPLLPPPGPPLAAPAEMIDVELVTLPNPGPPAGSAKGWLGFSQRDWILLGFGGAGVLILLLVVILVFLLLGGGRGGD